MATVAILVANDFEDPEFQVPYQRLLDAEHTVIVASTHAPEALAGKRRRQTAFSERRTDELDPDVFDALVIPGGYSPDKLRLDPAAVSFTHEMAASGKPVAAVCHAGSLLIEAEVVRGVRMTSWPSIRTDLENAGADWVDDEVVVDHNLITSRKPDDLPAFSAALLDALAAVPSPTPS